MNEQMPTVDIQFSNNEVEALELINTATKVILVVCDVVGKSLVYTLYSGLAPLKHIQGVINYCSNISKAQEFFKGLKTEIFITDKAMFVSTKCLEIKAKATLDT